MNVIVFIDGLGFESACAAGFADDFDHARPLRPGVGYTVNITTELFAGLTPDAAGFFNKWGMATERAPLGDRPRLARALSPLSRWPTLDLAVRRQLRRAGRDTARIPWRLCTTFGKIGTDVLHGPNTPRSIAADGALVLAHPHRMPGPDDDPAVVELARQAIGDGRDVLVYLTFLDGVGHDVGPGDPAYTARAALYRRWVRELADLAVGVDRHASVVVVSDHAMTTVTRHVAPPRAIGRVMAFVDSVMVRVWGSDADVAAVADPLVDAGVGAVLDEADRTRFGVTRPEWGDAIVLLEPGGLFVPDFFTGVYRDSGRPALGMHGYHPDREETWGCYFASGGGDAMAPPPPGPVTPTWVHSRLADRIAEESRGSGEP